MNDEIYPAESLFLIIQHSSLPRTAFFARANRAKIIPRINPGIMSILPCCQNAIAAGGSKRDKFIHSRREHRELWRGIMCPKNSFAFAGRAGAFLTKKFERIMRDVTVIPCYDQFGSLPFDLECAHRYGFNGGMGAPPGFVTSCTGNPEGGTNRAGSIGFVVSTEISRSSCS